MRLIVVTVHAPLGPAEAFAAAELTALRTLGHRVTIAPVRPLGQVIHRGFDEAADSVLVAPLVSPAVLAGAVAELIRAPRTVAAMFVLLARSGTARILAKNLAVFPKALWLARRARRQKVDHIHAYWATTPATVGMVAAAVAGTGFTFTAHAADIDENNLIRLKSTRATVLRAISRDGQRRLLQLGVSPGKLRLVRLGVDVPVRGVTRPSRPGRLAVVVPAALHPKKGHTDMFEAVRLLGTSSPAVNVHLELAGSGPLEAELRRRARELGVEDSVTFLGQLTHEALLARYRGGFVDAVALASVTFGARLAEGIPVSLIEALAHGIPVVATDSGGVGELVDDTTGLLVPMRDPKALADAFRRLALDHELGDRLGAAGRARVQERYDVNRTAVQLAESMVPSPSLADA